MVNVIDNFITLQFLRMTIATTSFNRLVFSCPNAITPANAAAMVLKNIPPNMNEMVKLKIGARWIVSRATVDETYSSAVSVADAAVLATYSRSGAAATSDGNEDAMAVVLLPLVVLGKAEVLIDLRRRCCGNDSVVVENAALLGEAAAMTISLFVATTTPTVMILNGHVIPLWNTIVYGSMSLPCIDWEGRSANLCLCTLYQTEAASALRYLESRGGGGRRRSWSHTCHIQ